MSELAELHPDACALTAFRVLPDGRGRNYTLAVPESGRRGIKHVIRMARACGFIKPPSHEPSYAVLDVWADPDVAGENWGVIQDFCIPTAEAWRWWYRTLGLRVDYTDGDPIPGLAQMRGGQR